MTITMIIDAIEAAQDNWTGADWPHEQKDADGHVIVVENEHGDDVPVYCDSDDEDHCQVCRDAARDASGAIECGNQAIAAIRRGDVKEALSHISSASCLESEYGDDPVWGPVREMIAARATEADHAR